MQRHKLPAEAPLNYNSRFDHGVDHIKVRLINPPEAHLAAEAVAVFAETTFGDIRHPNYYRGTVGGDDDAWRIAQEAAEFKHVIPNALETVALTFTIDGVSRSLTHQLVRTRVGAGFGQFSQRANNVAGFNMRLPMSLHTKMPPGAINRYYESISHLQRFYETAIESGVPYQDARYVVPEGIQTSITATYNLLALIGTVRRRVCNRMQWEINCVARLMADLTVRALPWIGKAMRSGCETRGVCQTVDPMFEPSCMSWSEEKEQADWCSDSPALIEMMAGGDYNWDRWSNGTMVFHPTDVNRINAEAASKGSLIMSMGYQDTTQQLAAKNADGLWRNA